MNYLATVRRAFASDLRDVAVREDERAKLEAASIREPTFQRFFAWRRGVASLVVLISLLTAALATYRDFAEPHEPPSLFQTISGDVQSLTGVEVIAEETNDPEAGEMSATEPDEDPDESDNEPTTAFGQFADAVHLISVYSVPLAAAAVLVFWTRPKLSFRILLAGFLFAFFVPMLVALCPWSWWGYVEPQFSPGDTGVEHFQDLAEGIFEALEYFILLMPTVLSLVPGVQRACLRIKTLLPESTIPGWFLVSAAPFYALFLLVLFVAINQVVSDPLLLIGMFLLLAAPFIYVARADVFTAPLVAERDYLRMRRVRQTASGVSVVAAILLVAYLTTREIFGIRLVGLDPAHSLLQPLDIVEYVLEFLGRMLFMTVLGADLFLRMTWISWRHSKAFEGTPAAARYDQVMRGFDETAALDEAAL